MKNNLNNINQQMNEDDTAERVDALSTQLNQVSGDVSGHLEELSGDLKELDAAHTAKVSIGVCLC